MEHSKYRRITNLFGLSKKVALVVGGSGYLGKEIVQTIAELGGSVVVASRNEDLCREIAESLPKINLKQDHFGLNCDLTNRNSLSSLQDHIITRYSKPVDIIVNAAWAGKKSTWLEMSDQDWHNDIDTCLTGAFKLIQTFAPKMFSGSSIINIASMYGHVAPDPALYSDKKHINPPSYGAAKGGLIQLTKYFASFLGQMGIRVNAISPGPFPFKQTESDSNFISELNKRTILNRVGKPEDLSGVIALLASDASSYITGQNICVDGGWTTR